MAHNKKEEAASTLFLPLIGLEQASRLEEKFGRYLDSDDDSKPCTSNLGKVSQGNFETSSPVEWLNSQKGTSAHVAARRKQRIHRMKKRSGPDDKSGPADKQQAREKSLLLSGTDRRNKETEADNRCKEDVSIASIEEADMTDGLNDGSQSEACWSLKLTDTERPKLAIAPSSNKVDFRLSTDDSKPPVVVPATINQYLRDYQREGINFLYQHYNARTGAILGDDMGLGKTIQVIGFLSALLGKQGTHVDTLHTIPKFIRQMSNEILSSPPRRASKPFLIIGPSAVMYNWLDELKTWGYFTASKFHGTDKETCLDNLKKQKLEIIVTTFETFRDNVEKLNQVEWEAVIVDEVHKIKGLKAQVTQALRTINTPCRFGLTGTVLQNNMTELWSLLDWVRPGVLGTLEQFEKEFVQVIELGQQHDATKRELAQARKQKDKFSEIRKRMLLRRTKALIADQLPSKEDLVVMCRLSEVQISVYRAILTHPDMKLVLCAEDPCDCRSDKARASCCYKQSTNGTKSWALVFSFMHLMLKAANHMALLIPDKNTKEKQADLAKSVCKIAFKDHPQFIEQTHVAASRTLSDPEYCGKMKVLQGLLSAFYTNHDKVLIFSYSTRLLDIIEQYVICQGHEYRRIDGKVSSRHRQDIVTQFNSDRNIFLCLISTKSGGIGLNLTGANRVVIFDPNWNPSHDLQAQDRAYRIGQTRDVKVYRLISAGTIEENIYLRQIYKQQLDEVAIGTSNARRYFHGIQRDKNNRGELFGIKNMFSLRTGNSCLTMDILKRNDKLERGMGGYDITRYVPLDQVSTTDSIEEDDENSGMDDRSLIDSDVEDEEFLRELFGSDRSPIISKTAQNANQSCSAALLTDSCKDSVTSLNTLKKVVSNAQSDSDDGEFSLIPKLHKKPQHLACRTENNENLASNISTSQSRGLALDTPPLLGDNGGVLSADKISFSDITFSSRTCETSDVLQQFNTSDTRKRGAVSGISWLFSDSDDDDDDDEEDNEKQVKNQGINTKKAPADFSRSAIFSTPVSGEVKSSVYNTKDNIIHSKIMLPENLKGLRGSTTKAVMPSAAAKENVSLEQLVLRSNDVLCTHMNTNVVGPSRAEDHMTHCAMQEVFELHTNSQVPALQCDPYSQSEDSKPTKRKSSRGSNKPKDDHNTVKSISSGSFKILVGQTPASIKSQHWSDLSKFMKIDHLTLAKTLLTSDVQKRLDVLKEFYSHKHPQLTEVLASVLTFKPDENTGPDHADEKACKDPNHPSRSNTKKCRPNGVPKSSDKSCVLPQFEDSITALPPKNQNSPCDNRPDNFLPVPPSSSRKLSSSAKVLPCRSRTRLRNKKDSSTADRVKLDKYFSFGDPGRSNSTVSEYSINGSLLSGSTSDIHCNTETLRNSAVNKKRGEPVEDIGMLLHDMGQKCSVRGLDGLQHYQSSSRLDDKKDSASAHTTARAQGCTAARKTAIQCGSGTTQQDVNSGERSIGCILDDIFSPCAEMQAQIKCDKKEDFNRERNYLSQRLNARPDVRVAKSKHSEQSIFSTKGANESLLSQTDSIFDDLLRTSTLKDERVDSIVRSNKKRHPREKEATVEVDAKGKWERINDKKVEMDIDDLSWCKFDTGSATPQSEDGSKSLFS